MVAADTSVRVAWPADAPAIAAVQLRAWQRYDARRASYLSDRGVGLDDLGAAWASSLSRPPEARHRALVALERNRVVGFALTGPNTDPDADPAGDGELAELTVDPDEVAVGHGSRLLQAAVDTLVADGFTRAVCWVTSTDDTVRGFLTSAGWATDGATRELADDEGGSVRQVRLHTAIA
jgi:GNAT superfamily N-acetyltransferase